jgi:hypothetical protein
MILIILIISLLYCNEMFLLEPYFQQRELRDSMSRYLEITDILYPNKKSRNEAALWSICACIRRCKNVKDKTICEWKLYSQLPGHELQFVQHI